MWLKVVHSRFLPTTSLLNFAIGSRTDRHSPREVRHLDFIAQFTTDIRHVSASDNVADALSRFVIALMQQGVDLDSMASAQATDLGLLTSCTQN